MLHKVKKNIARENLFKINFDVLYLKNLASHQEHPLKKKSILEREIQVILLCIYLSDLLQMFSTVFIFCVIFYFLSF